MRICKLMAVTMFVGISFPVDAFGIEPVNPNLNPAARQVLHYLDSVYQTKMLCGYNVYVHTPDDYEQTGKQAAIWGRDIRWLDEPSVVVEHAKRHGYLLTLYWHWFYNEDSAWSSAKNGDEWIYVDLERVYSIERVNVLWGWKIHAQDYTIDIALEDPERPTSWTTIYSETDHPYTTWEATYRISFGPTLARYVRLHATKRAGRQTWGGYQLAAFEIPVPLETVSVENSPRSKN